MPKWIVSILVVENSEGARRRGATHRSLDAPNQAEAIAAALKIALPCEPEQDDQLLIYASPDDDPLEEKGGDAEYAKQFFKEMDLPHRDGTPEEVARWTEKAQRHFDEVKAKRSEKPPGE
jgi:hypothetical protein